MSEAVEAGPVRARPRPLLLAGPTAVGKSEVALRLAEQWGGEIISVDSMQVYRGLDIGTAKPTTEQRARVPHHLIDVVAVTEPFDAAQFERLAGQAVAEIQARGRTPILCGGTGLYFRAFLHGLGQAPASNLELRRELEQKPLAELCAELEQGDPLFFATIDRQNPRRVIRAVEVLRQTGQTFSSLRGTWNRSAPWRDNACFVVLTREVGSLLGRLERRVDEMFAAGLIRETGQALADGLRSNRNAMQAIGYKQVVEHLDGERSLAHTVALVKVRTRQFAKRQTTWFRREAKTIRLQITEGQTAVAVADAVASAYAEG